MRKSKQIIAFIVCFATVFTFSVFSASASSVSSSGTFWQSVAAKSPAWLQTVIGAVSNGVCSVSDDAKHHGRLISSTPNSDGSFTAICDSCSERFPVYGVDLSAAYDEYVNQLPASGITSSGSFIWYPTISDLATPSIQVFRITQRASAVQLSPEKPSWVLDNVTYSLLDDRSASVYASVDGYFLLHSYGVNSAYNFIAPLTGFYRQIASTACVGFYLKTSNTRVNLNHDYPASSSAVHLNSGSQLAFNRFYYDFMGDGVNTVCFSGKFYLPVFEVTLDNLDDIPADSYSVNTRPTSITGDYGIIGDNGQITKVDSNTIVNETTNTVYNPVTNTTSNITDWQYDYSSRTYTVTLDNGTTQTITYGDENITINEGDTVYNVYYIMDDSGNSGGSDIPSSCDHDYTSTVTTQPTCTAPGLRTYTCGKCSNTYTERIPATGHSWTVKQTVATEYGEDGTLITQGYTIYKCSVCDEEYKSTDGTSPPGGSGDEEVTKEGFFSWLWGGIKKLFSGVFDAIIGLIDFLFPENGQSNLDFYTNPSTFAGGSVWEY